MVILLGELFAFHENEQPEDYIVNYFTIENGLPQNTIHSILQTHDGFIWIGTPSGLVRFDGLDFRIYTRWDVPELKNDNITCLYEDSNQTLWIGTEGGGICTLKDGQWNHYTTDNGLSSDYVRVILSDLNGDIWVGTDYGLNQISKEGIRVYTERDGLYDNTITALSVDNWNNLWIGTFRSGLAKFTQGSISILAYEEGLKNLSVRSLCADEKGTLWIGTQQGIFFLRREESIIHELKGTSYTPINTIIEKSPNELWIGTMVSGLKKIYPPDLTRRPVTDLLIVEFIHCILEDNAGNIWIGTDTEGLIQLKVRRIDNLTTDQGLPENAASAVFQDRSGTLWIGTKNKGLFCFKGNGSGFGIDTEKGLPSNQISVIFEDLKGTLWIGTENAGICLIDELRVTSKINEQSGLISNRINCIGQDKSGLMWIGTSEGLQSYSGGNFKTYITDTESTNKTVNVLLESRSGVLYAGMDDGAYQLKNNRLQTLNHHTAANYKIVSLYEDKNEILWMGTAGDGLIRWSGDNFDMVTKDAGLHDNFILSIIDDKDNNMWMSSHTGIFWVQKNDLTEYINNKASRLHTVWYSEDEGMNSRQCSGEGQPSVSVMPIITNKNSGVK